MMGASLLYHLALEGCTDTVLIEKDELTSGSTWHAAGQCPSITGSYNLAKIHAYSKQLYPRLEALTGQYTSWHACGGLRLANNPAELAWLKYVYGLLQEHRLPHGHRRARRDQAAESLSDHGQRDSPPPGPATTATATRRASAMRWPRRRAIWARRSCATIGCIDMRRRAERRMGSGHRARHHRRRDGGECRGLLCPRGRRHGRRRRAHHQHAASLRDHASDPGVPWNGSERDSGDARLLHLRVFPAGAEIRADGDLRERRAHRSLGAARGIPEWDASNELFADDLDRIAPWLERAIERMPIFGEVGIRRVINGAIPHTPDGAPLLGPAPGLQEFLDVLRNLLRHRSGRRLRQVSRAVDDARRCRDQHDGIRSAALRPVRGQAATCATRCSWTIGLTFTTRLPGEEEPGGTSEQDEPAVRAAEGARLRVHRDLRLGAPEVVLARRPRRGVRLSPQQCLRGGARRGRRRAPARGDSRSHRIRQVRHQRRRRRSLFESRLREPDSPQGAAASPSCTCSRRRAGFSAR